MKKKNTKKTKKLEEVVSEAIYQIKDGNSRFDQHQEKTCNNHFSIHIKVKIPFCTYALFALDTAPVGHYQVSGEYKNAQKKDIWKESEEEQMLYLTFWC